MDFKTWLLDAWEGQESDEMQNIAFAAWNARQAEIDALNKRYDMAKEIHIAKILDLEAKLEIAKGGLINIACGAYDTVQMNRNHATHTFTAIDGANHDRL